MVVIPAPLQNVPSEVLNIADSENNRDLCRAFRSEREMMREKDFDTYFKASRSQYPIRTLR